jgi:hypothetical protein
MAHNKPLNRLTFRKRVTTDAIRYWLHLDGVICLEPRCHVVASHRRGHRRYPDSYDGPWIISCSLCVSALCTIAVHDTLSKAKHAIAQHWIDHQVAREREMLLISEELLTSAK